MYASFHGGFLYRFEVTEFEYREDYEGFDSCNRWFWMLLHSIKYRGYRSALVTNVVDYPSKKFKHKKPFDIAMLFDFELIKNLKKIR